MHKTLRPRQLSCPGSCFCYSTKTPPKRVSHTLPKRSPTRPVENASSASAKEIRPHFRPPIARPTRRVGGATRKPSMWDENADSFLLDLNVSRIAEPVVESLKRKRQPTETKKEGNLEDKQYKANVRHATADRDSVATSAPRLRSRPVIQTRLSPVLTSFVPVSERDLSEEFVKNLAAIRKKRKVERMVRQELIMRKQTIREKQKLKERVDRDEREAAMLRAIFPEEPEIKKPVDRENQVALTLQAKFAKDSQYGRSFESSRTGRRTQHDQSTRLSEFTRSSQSDTIVNPMLIDKELTYQKHREQLDLQPERRRASKSLDYPSDLQQEREQLRRQAERSKARQTYADLKRIFNPVSRGLLELSSALEDCETASSKITAFQLRKARLHLQSLGNVHLTLAHFLRRTIRRIRYSADDYVSSTQPFWVVRNTVHNMDMISVEMREVAISLATGSLRDVCSLLPSMVSAVMDPASVIKVQHTFIPHLAGSSGTARLLMLRERILEFCNRQKMLIALLNGSGGSLHQFTLSSPIDNSVPDRIRSMLTYAMHIKESMVFALGLDREVAGKIGPNLTSCANIEIALRNMNTSALRLASRHYLASNSKQRLLLAEEERAQLEANKMRHALILSNGVQKALEERITRRRSLLQQLNMMDAHNTETLGFLQLLEKALQRDETFMEHFPTLHHLSRRIRVSRSSAVDVVFDCIADPLIFAGDIGARVAPLPIQAGRMRRRRKRSKISVHVNAPGSSTSSSPSMSSAALTTWKPLPASRAPRRSPARRLRPGKSPTIKAPRRKPESHSQKGKRQASPVAAAKDFPLIIREFPKRKRKRASTGIRVSPLAIPIMHEP